MTLKLVKHVPQMHLASYVESILYVEGNNKGAGLPKTAMSLVFNLRDDFKLFENAEFKRHTDFRRHWVAGLQTGPRYVESYGTSSMIVVQFKTLGAAAFFRDQMSAFTDRYVPLDCVFGAAADETWERLLESTLVEDLFRITEEFLLGFVHDDRKSNSRLIEFVDARLRSHDRFVVDSVCKDVGVSRKHLNDVFKSVAGVSPKMLASLHRFQRILRAITVTRPERLTDFAYELEYFDQSHFNNDFKRFTSLRPSEYMSLIDDNPSLKTVPHFLPVLAR